MSGRSSGCIYLRWGVTVELDAASDMFDGGIADDGIADVFAGVYVAVLSGDGVPVAGGEVGAPGGEFFGEVEGSFEVAKGELAWATEVDPVGAGFALEGTAKGGVGHENGATQRERHEGYPGVVGGVGHDDALAAGNGEAGFFIADVFERGGDAGVLGCEGVDFCRKSGVYGATCDVEAVPVRDGFTEGSQQGGHIFVGADHTDVQQPAGLGSDARVGGVPVDVVPVRDMDGVIEVNFVVFAEHNLGCGVVVEPSEAFLGCDTMLVVGGTVMHGADDAGGIAFQALTPQLEEGSVGVPQERTVVGDQIFWPVNMDDVVTAKQGTPPRPR